MKEFETNTNKGLFNIPIHIGQLSLAIFLVLLLSIPTVLNAAEQIATVSILSSFNITNGTNPDGRLTFGKDGNLYGTTKYGGIIKSGSAGWGTLFKCSKTGSLTTLLAFPTNSAGLPTSGANPEGTVSIDNDGNIYGTTTGGGNPAVGGLFGSGTVFLFSGGNSPQVLLSFKNYNGSGTNSTGAAPDSGLILGQDGNFYGTTSAGGLGAGGTVFRITPAGEFTNIFYLQNGLNGITNNTGSFPEFGLVADSDGMLYGSTFHGGMHGNGAIFKVSQDGNFTLLGSFDSSSNSPSLKTATNTFGLEPSDLAFGSDGNLYGTTVAGGTNGFGTVFKISTSGGLSCIYTFGQQLIGTNDLGPIYADGRTPFAGLTLATDGNLYGVTSRGGSNNWGTIFRIKTDGTLETLGSFDSTVATPNGLTQGSDGNFYGSCYYGGTIGAGAIFKITLVPVLNLVKDQQAGGGSILTWSDPTFTLQSSPFINGVFTNISSISPFTNLATEPQQFFRLKSN
jgi:uncharacterized repeat protein (TIGR03803 family)